MSHACNTTIIADYSHYLIIMLPKADREAALSLADALTEDLAAMLANQSYTLAALGPIKPRMLDLARQGGCRLADMENWRILYFSS